MEKEIKKMLENEYNINIVNIFQLGYGLWKVIDENGNEYLVS